MFDRLFLTISQCHECQKGFRISGHLARHNKAEIHMKRLQELRELGIQPTTPKMSVIQQQSPITTTITDSQAPLPVISDRTVSSTTVDVPPRSHTPESEGLCSHFQPKKLGTLPNTIGLSLVERKIRR